MDKEFYKYITSPEGKKALEEENSKIAKFCEEHNITWAKQEFFFELFGLSFRVSRFGPKVSGAISLHEKLLCLENTSVDKSDVIHIKGAKKDIIRIYNDLVNGIELDYDGSRVNGEPIEPEVKPQPVVIPDEPKVQEEPAPEPKPIQYQDRTAERNKAINDLFRRR
jgi:hypothetical protein